MRENAQKNTNYFYKIINQRNYYRFSQVLQVSSKIIKSSY